MAIAADFSGRNHLTNARCEPKPVQARIPIVQIHPHNDPADLRKKLARLAGSCPDFPLREPVRGRDVPRDFNW